MRVEGLGLRVEGLGFRVAAKKSATSAHSLLVRTPMELARCLDILRRAATRKPTWQFPVAVVIPATPPQASKLASALLHRELDDQDWAKEALRLRDT